MRGFLVVLAMGLVLLALAALRDRHTRRLAEAQLGIPLEHLGATPASTPDESQQAALDAFRTAQPRFDAPLADERFASWASPATLELTDVDLLCCAEGVGSRRELMDSLAVARRTGRHLVVVCPAPEESLVGLLASAPSGTARTPLLVADPQTCSELAQATGGRPATRADLQSGAAPSGHGKARRLVADATGCWVQGPDES
ncbi:hypothetical protein EDD41_1332 [Luteococcus japonicus]|uniref:Uncharacterized protein n=2 Tax=Luteococcus japonicus TaxID=33984 RepID=A0A1R4KEU5_9ACTN|nr:MULTISPECIES: hypothetical protein [Luteococcus]MDN5563035.1 hypothetical protein [Luteococcus sp.]ROR54144.1 hypothetical protein EDD41_1332 [Luteococcus japonicus]SJN42712.1 hypothetical protein FM114_13675 [Luteococcus japonicus LSP_Lj1]